MITGKISCGYKFSIDDSKFDDMELLDLLGELDTNPFYMGKVIEKLLGKSEKKKLYELLRTDEGNVPVQSTSNAINEIFQAGKESKKS